MKLNKKDPNRLGVFIFFDRDGIVDDYVLYLLKSLKEATKDLIIVSNSYLSPAEKRKLESFSSKIKVRPNIGLDAGAFKDAYDEYKEYFQQFDELLFVNDTFFGPFIPFKDICQTMDKKDLDFWGLSANYDSEDGYGFLPDHMIHSHIQTYFIAFRNTVLKSKAFNEYWEKYNVNKMNTFIDVVTKHEIQFTHYLEQAGFKWDVYTNLEKYHGQKLEENFNYYAYSSYDLIKNCNCPFFKRKNLVFDKKDALYLNDGADAAKSLHYLKENKLYDTNMIWKNILRLYSAEDIYYGLNLNYLIQERKESAKNYVILFLLEEEKYLQYFIKYLKESSIKSYEVITNNIKIKEKLEKEKINYIQKEEFDKNKYDYICIIKDNYTKKQEIPIVFENNINTLITNGLENEKYIYGVLDKFNENKYLGAFLMPASVNGGYFEDYSNKNNKIIANENGVWVSKDLFDWNITNSINFVKEYITRCTEKQKAIGKVYNYKEIPNILSNQEYIIKKTYQSLREHHGTITNTLTESLYHIQHTKCFIPQKNKLKVKIYNFLRKIKHKFF